MRTRLVALGAHLEFRNLKEAVDDHVAALDSIVDKLGRLAVGPNQEERRHLALGDVVGEGDVGLAAVVEDRRRPPGRMRAADLVAKV
jgi:hypothetical protein